MTAIECDCYMLEALMAIDTFGLILLNEDLEILKFSDGAEKIIGQKKEAVIGRSIREFIPFEYKTQHEKYISEFIDSDAETLKITRNHFIPLMTLNHELTKAEFTISKHRVSSGHFLYSVIIKDISDKIKLEEDVELSVTRLRSAINADEMTIFEIDYETQKISYFGIMEELFANADTPDKFKELIFQRLSKESAQKVYDAFNEHLKNKIPISLEMELLLDNNTSNWFNVYAEMLYDNYGKRIKFIGALKNITEGKIQQFKIEEGIKKAREAGEAKTKLLAAVSHEMRTPLNGIFGGLQQLELFNSNAKDNSHIGMIEKSAKRLLSVVDEILGIENIDENHEDIFAKEISIDEFCEKMVQQYDPYCKTKKLRFNIINNCEQYNINLNQHQLLLIVENLVQNAIKYTPKGSVNLVFDRNEKGLIIEIIDTGIGINSENLGIIMQTLENGDDSLPESFAGSGIGLIAAYRLICSMGGNLEIISIPNEGTNMRINLPAKFRVNTGNKVCHIQHNDANDEDDHVACVLIAEDNDTNQAVLKAFMEAMDIKTNIVENGLEALNAYIVGNYDFVLMDIKMPEMDGKEATQRIRHYEQVNNIPRRPIIAVTANALPHQMEEYLACGMDAVVTKPISASHLYQAIDDAMETCDDINNQAEKFAASA